MYHVIRHLLTHKQGSTFTDYFESSTYDWSIINNIIERKKVFQPKWNIKRSQSEEIIIKHDSNCLFIYLFSDRNVLQSWILN